VVSTRCVAESFFYLEQYFLGQSSATKNCLSLLLSKRQYYVAPENAHFACTIACVRLDANPASQDGTGAFASGTLEYVFQQRYCRAWEPLTQADKNWAGSWLNWPPASLLDPHFGQQRGQQPPQANSDKDNRWEADSGFPGSSTCVSIRL